MSLSLPLSFPLRAVWELMTSRRILHIAILYVLVVLFFHVWYVREHNMLLGFVIFFTSPTSGQATSLARQTTTSWQLSYKQYVRDRAQQQHTGADTIPPTQKQAPKANTNMKSLDISSKKLKNSTDSSTSNVRVRIRKREFLATSTRVCRGIRFGSVGVSASTLRVCIAGDRLETKTRKPFSLIDDIFTLAADISDFW